MKTISSDKNCPCTTCLIVKLHEVLNEPIPNVIKCAEHIQAYFNYEDRHPSEEIKYFSPFRNYIQKIFDNIYGDIDDMKMWLELAELVLVDLINVRELSDSRARFLNGSQHISEVDIQKRKNYLSARTIQFKDDTDRCLNIDKD